MGYKSTRFFHKVFKLLAFVWETYGIIKKRPELGEFPVGVPLQRLHIDEDLDMDHNWTQSPRFKWSIFKEKEKLHSLHLPYSKSQFSPENKTQ